MGLFSRKPKYPSVVSVNFRSLTYGPEARWIAICRFVAGLSGAPESVIVPDGFPKISPASGEASPDVASQHGSMWWRAYKLSQELGLPQNEVDRFHEIALHWYGIRDKG